MLITDPERIILCVLVHSKMLYLSHIKGLVGDFDYMLTLNKRL